MTEGHTDRWTDAQTLDYRDTETHLTMHLIVQFIQLFDSLHSKMITTT